MIEEEKIVNEIVKKILKKGYKRVVLQFPDGLKPLAVKIAKEVEEKTNAEVFIWYGSNFGACDVPIWLKLYRFDAIFNIGHSKQKWTSDFCSLV